VSAIFDAITDQCFLNQVKVLRSIPAIERHDTLLGQYVGANGKPGYLDDETVPPNSTCPTFAITTLFINNPRWEGVPFILKAGKGLPATIDRNFNTQHS
jgi:glucose-6-phosphate 1-dehydrogenase